MWDARLREYLHRPQSTAHTGWLSSRSKQWCPFLRATLSGDASVKQFPQSPCLFAAKPKVRASRIVQHRHRGQIEPRHDVLAGDHRFDNLYDLEPSAEPIPGKRRTRL